MIDRSKKPLISVIICNYNYGRYIGEAIESVFNQTYPNLELIIIDDGSTDNSRAVIEGLLSKKTKNISKITYITQANKGIVASRNKGLELAKGKFILYLDSDNFLAKNFISVLAEYATEHDLDVAYTDIAYFGDVNQTIVMPDFDIELLKARNIIDMSSLILKAAIKGVRFDKNLEKLSHEDWDFFLGLALDGAIFAKAKGVKLSYRIHGNSRNAVTGRDIDKNIVRFMKMYSYIIEKYKHMYPQEIDFSARSEIAERLKKSFQLERLKQELAESRKIIKYNESLIQAKNKEIQVIKNSIAYKITRAITYPLRAIKELMK